MSPQTKKKLFLTFILPSIILMLVSETHAATYYVSPAGKDTYSGSETAPWATFNHAMAVLQPGDTLYLEDGTYTQTLAITVSGTAANIITFAAVNDGNAIVSTTYPDSALTVANNVAYVEVDGISFRNSGPVYANDPTATLCHGINIGSADHLTLRRVTSNGSSGYNSAVISLAGATNSLLEDCAASGQGRIVLNILASDNVVVRRCWLSWSGPNTGGGDTPNVVQVYDSSNVLMENNIGVNYTSAGIGFFNTWGHDSSIGGNSFYGNVGYNTNSTVAGGMFEDSADCGNIVSGTIFSNNVAILSGAGGEAAMEMNANPDNGSVFTNNTFVSPNNTGGGLALSYRPSCPNQYSAVANASGNSFLNTWSGLAANAAANNYINAHNYNNFYNMYGGYGPLYMAAYMVPSSLNTHEIQTNPNYDISTYGLGAYLVVPDVLKGNGESGANIGAEVLYEYQNGILTGIPLWPWPMEQRVINEFQGSNGYGISATYSDDGNGHTGGFWKTLCGAYETSYSITETVSGGEV